MTSAIYNHRTALARTRRQIGLGQLTVGFLGGSITEPVPRHNWCEGVIAWFVEKFPQVQITVENAAIGGTGSDLAVFRAEREIIGRGCDLVFVEYAVNDLKEPIGKRGRSREGLIRKLLNDGDRDVVLVYSFHHLMYADMSEGRIPASIAEFEQLAEHYGISSVWMGLHALEEVRGGKMRWDEWLPDGLHPTSRGSWSYAESVNHFLRKELLDELSEGLPSVRSGLPAPIDADNWERTSLLPWAEVKREGPWVVRRWDHVRGAGLAMITSAPGARLSFSFAGRGLVLGFDFGKKSAEFRYRLDGGEWTEVVRERAAWCPEDGWFRPYLIGDDLGTGYHHCEIEVVHGNRDDCKGTDFHLLFIGIVH
ncbi:SGNH/GDSL hydrolase family protein [Cohnella soli]|uniref:SGNH/GDSL hydrolase family protein n=1 Tax=Cohnella soli TaxID=425005 RepID=A0ABW0HNV3_9BACL